VSLKRFLELDLLDNRYPALHGLRFFAIISVVQFHVTWVFAGETAIKLDPDWVASSLAVFFGMDLFFVLSGFLIGSILLRSLDIEGTQRIGRFYLRRVFRTFPSYYVVLTYLALTTALTANQWHNLRYEYFYLTNFVSLLKTDVVMFWGWSLALEEQFYLTVPLLFVVLYLLRSDRARVGVLAALWASALVTRLVIFYRHRPWTDLALYSALYFRTHTRFDALIAGIMLAFVQLRWREPIGRWLTDPFHRAVIAIPSLGCLWILLVPWVFGQKHTQLVHVFAWGTVTSLMYFGFLLLFLHGDGWIQRSLAAPIFRRLATLGYGVYLVHIPILYAIIVPIAHALDARHVSMVLVWPLSLTALMGLSLGLGYILHVLIEKPSLQMRDRLAG
jgi:peptidoglycan/LPS O-acetylase OafA/YrhL